MLTLEQIEAHYSAIERGFKRNLLREYLQYKILEIIFSTKYAHLLSFLGGTALRILYGNSRFSEDLDFDNFGLLESQFDDLSHQIQLGLEREGYKVEMNTVSKGAYRCKIRLPEILFVNELSPHQEEKILIQIDTAPHDFKYEPDKKILNKFDIFAEIFTTPIDILLSQKLYAAINRKRAKGRDFYDIVFLFSLTKPNYQYLALKMDIFNPSALKKELLSRITDFDFKELGRDVRAFLINPSSVNKVELFPEFIKQLKL